MGELLVAMVLTLTFLPACVAWFRKKEPAGNGENGLAPPPASDAARTRVFARFAVMRA